MRKIDKQTGEISPIFAVGLWAPLPINAYRILAEAREHSAQRLLMCLISHLGSEGMDVWPSYSLISKESGLSRGSIRRAILVLEKMGFLRVTKRRTGRHLRNHYKILLETYSVDSLPDSTKNLLPRDFRCMSCLKVANRVEFGTDGRGNKIHFGCGGTAFPITRKNSASAVCL